MAFNFVPAGTILPFGGAAAPSGWLLCDGSAVSRSTYASLFSSISTAWGYGDNSTTFNLPDMRGRFPRGRDAGVARDPDRAGRTAANTGGNTGDNVGSVQIEATKKNGLAVSGGTASLSGSAAPNTHSHGPGSLQACISGLSAQTLVWARSSLQTWTYTGAVGVNNEATTSGSSTNAVNIVGTSANNSGSAVTLSNTAASIGAGDSETRPLNANVNFIIKI
jgi:microcystin-dependent protein